MLFRSQPQIKPARILVLLLAVLAPVLLVGGTVYGYLQIQALRSEIARIQRERAELGPLYDDVMNTERTLNAVRGKLASMEKVTATHLDPVEILKALNGVVPENVMITNLTLAAGGGITITGNASDYYGVAALQLKMLVSRDFGETILGNAAGADSISYQLTSTYTASASPQANAVNNQGISQPQASASSGQASPAGADGPPAGAGGVE